MRKIVLLCVLLLLPVLSDAAGDRSVPASDRLTAVRGRLDSLAQLYPQYNESVDVSVVDFPVAELVKSLAVSGALSVNINIDRKTVVTCNLSQVPLKDVLYFLCARKDLDVQIDAGVLTVLPYTAPALVAETRSRRQREEPSSQVVPEVVTVAQRGPQVRVVPLQYRTTDRVVEVIPESLRQGVEIKVSPDLNSLVVSGDAGAVGRVEAFVKEIDRKLPLISIAVMMVDTENKFVRSTGITFGKGTGPSGQTVGTLSPGVDVSLGADGLNRLISSFNGIGTFNLGRVGPNFYAHLQLLEETGKVELRSTPRLATLSGSKAVLKSGEVKYYRENHVNIIGTQNPMQSESYIWKEVEANFILDITPTVSADSTITLRIELSQDAFTERDTGDMTAPPGITKRSFTSTVKVRDGEMVLLGGIEKNVLDNTGKGLPYIAQVPVLRALFGKTRRERSLRKLSVFILPTVIE